MSSRELLPESVGFRNQLGLAARGRTTMIPELTTLLDIAGKTASLAAYRDAVETDNVLAKPSSGVRRDTFSYLRDRYTLDPSCALIRTLRVLWGADPMA